MIGTKRFPLKNDKAIGNFTWLNRLYIAAATNPATIPTNTLLSIVLKAGLTSVRSPRCNNPCTESADKTV